MVNAPGDLGADEPRADATGDVKGPECPKCGDRFPSEESLRTHVDEEHKLT